MNNDNFPIIEVGHIFNKFSGQLNKYIKLENKSIEIDYPCRLDAMAINPAAVCYNTDMVFTPGEVVISIKKFIKVRITVNDETNGILNISKKTKRKALVKHAYLLMCQALNVNPSLSIEVDDDDIPKHCGFGSSSSTIASVAVAINELYSCPISNSDLIKYLASNHGEEISDRDENNLKTVQCIGGGATSGLTDEGIVIIAGKSTTIAKMKYNADILIALPNDYIQKDAKILMELEEKKLWKFKKTGEKFSKEIAYDLLHKALPEMNNGNIRELADVVFEYRFNMGSNENCSFVYDGLMQISDNIKCLYEENRCELLALSSVGPAFFTIVKNNMQKEQCKNYMKKLGLKVMETSICNSKYILRNVQKIPIFWQKAETVKAFSEKSVSKYVTNVIDSLDIKNKNCVDIGCGGGRYSRYLLGKKGNVLAIDKNPEMFNENYKINFVTAVMNNIPVKDESFDLALSIGVLHNAITLEEYISSINELYRILKQEGNAIISVFTNDIIDDDLTPVSMVKYLPQNRPPMVLLSKEQINKLLKQTGFKINKKIDEHITDVGSGKRNVYTILIQK